MKRAPKRVLSFVLSLSLFLSLIPAPAASAAQPDTLAINNGNIEAVVSTKNGGFIIRTQQGDVIAKDDNNKDLLYRSDDYDTSFTSFQITEAGKTKEYIFGSDYSFLGLGGNNLTVTMESGAIKAVWTVDNLTFTQLLEPVPSKSSNEHGTVKISYSVVNDKGRSIAVKARMLLDTALGQQDYAYYELAKSGADGSGYKRIDKEQVLSEENGDLIPANFFGYDDYDNPGTAAYTIQDQSENAVKPYKLAFGHWNNLASTVFDFTPDGDLTFTNAYNKEYLTADSAAAFYYDLGSVAAGDRSRLVSTYYGVDSKVRVKDSDRVGVTVTSPFSLTLNEEKTDYLEPGENGEDTGVFEITTNITNLSTESAQRLDNVKMAILVDDGLTPLDSGGNVPDPLPNNKYPYTVDVSSLGVGEVRQLVWKVKADVLPDTSYRRVVFRAYDMSDSEDGLLTLDNLIGSSSSYILCPGGESDLPEITFTSAGPDVIYNQGIRHIYLTGTGFNLLKATGKYELRAYLKSDRSTYYVIPESNIIFSQETGVMDIVLDDIMPTGNYELVFEWQEPPEGIAQSLTAPALGFTVNADSSYRNDYYSILAVVKKGSGPDSEYEIKTFADENAFEAFDGNVLLVFRGGFTIDSVKDGAILASSAVSSSDKDTININGALDFENGNVQIYKDTSGSTDYLMVKFDGDLYTTNSRTAVWSGNASITPLNDGADYGLIKYDERGERIFGKQPPNNISLVWPMGFNMLQTIGGLALDFRYGQFGAMYADEDLTERTGYVVSFGGKLDMSFLMPGGAEQAQQLEREKYDSRSGSTSSKTEGDMLYQDINGYSPSVEANEENEKNKVEPAGKVNVEDLLFGKNAGYLGFNSQVEVMLPKYVQALPALGGELSINTIGGYDVGVLGKVETAKLGLEFELKVKNAPGDGRPVPDKIYFFMDGFEPGVNIDSAGAVWITGAGGGVDKLYDTIFSDGGVVPLTLILSTSFDIMKVMSGRSDLALSLRGFQFEMSDVQLKNTDEVVIESGQLVTQWNPGFYLQISAVVELLEVIEGNAYLVVDDDFFEMFLRAGVKVPDDVAIIGGMAISNANLGGNNDKIWGALSALGTKVGVTYYWGGDVGFGTGANAASPTYPELLGMKDVPVGKDEDTGRTLYMKLGTNISPAMPAQLVENLAGGGPVLMSADTTLYSDSDKKKHVLNLGAYTEEDAALSIHFEGANRPKTIAEAQQMLGITKPDGSPYVLTFYDGSNPVTANANLVVDDEADTTTVSVTITDYIAGDWNISTSQAADFVFYSIGAVPTVTDFKAKPGPEWDPNSRITMQYLGSKLDETEMDFYLVPANDSGNINELGTPFYSLGGTNSNSYFPPERNGDQVIIRDYNIPRDLPSGKYNIRMIVSKEGEVHRPMLAKSFDSDEYYTFNYTNPNPMQPGAPPGVSLENYGNNMLRVSVDTPPTGEFEGYRVSIYEDTGEGLVPTDYMNIPFAKDEEGNIPEMIVGGNYVTTENKTFGLTGGRKYVAKVAAYLVYPALYGSDYDQVLEGAEVESDPVLLREATPPEVAFVPQEGTYKTISKVVETGEGSEETYNIDTFTTNDVNFALKSDVSVTGSWSIDGVLSQDLLDPQSTGINRVTDTDTVNISQTLSDGEHTISFTGSDADGDSFTFSKIFAVDTMPPRLMLTSPTNGGFFSEEGTLTIEGLGDGAALYTVAVDGETVVERKTLSSLGASPDSSGRFSFDLTVDPGVLAHTVTVTALDRADNSTTTTATVKNIGLADIDTVSVLKNGLIYSNNNIPLADTGSTTAKLQLLATTGSGSQFVINDRDLVQWTSVTKKGSATIASDGNLTVSTGSVGFAEGTLRVSHSGGMTASVTFGAEIYGEGQPHLFLANSIGGTVTGEEGAYSSGSNVTLTAIPAPGYRFAGWSSTNGGSFSDATAMETTFTMPESDTIVKAEFSLINSENDDDRSNNKKIGYLMQGEAVSASLPESLTANENTVVPYYMFGGREIMVSVSSVVDGKILFTAPASAVYYVKQNQTVFDDTKNHWGKEAIDFTTARGLFNGVGNQKFAPDGQMTRSMFVTVIARLDGADLTRYGSSKFSDVPAGSWYGSSVEWAVQSGIVKGVSATEFFPDTPVSREEMALMLNNYLTFKGYKLKIKEENPKPFSDRESISDWAAEAVDKMNRYGIILGKPGNLADPRGNATRAECSTVFQRTIEAITAGNK